MPTRLHLRRSTWHPRRWRMRQSCCIRLRSSRRQDRPGWRCRRRNIHARRRSAPASRHPLIPRRRCRACRVRSRTRRVRRRNTLSGRAARALRHRSPPSPRIPVRRAHPSAAPMPRLPPARRRCPCRGRERPDTPVRTQLRRRMPAALPPKTRSEGLPPATRQAPPGVFVPVHPPAPANVPGAQPSRPGIAPQRRPATANEAHPAGLPPPEALPHTHPPAQAQTFHPPAPAVVRPAPAPVISRPPAPPVTHAAPSAPAVVHAPPPVVFHPPAPAIVHAPPPVVARPPAPAVIRAAPPVQQPARVAPSPALAHPQPAHAPQQAHGSKTSPTEKGKAGSKPE